MPHVNSSGGDDLASTDEVKVYKDEGEEEKRSSESLSEEKDGLVTETEEVGRTQNHGLPLQTGRNFEAFSCLPRLADGRWCAGTCGLHVSPLGFPGQEWRGVRKRREGVGGWARRWVKPLHCIAQGITASHARVLHQRDHCTELNLS